MNTIYDGSFVLGNTSATTYQAGPGISITQPSEGTVRISNDETVLWSGTNSNNTTAFTLSDKFTNYERVRVDARIGVGSFSVELPTLNLNDTNFRYGSTFYMAEADGSPLQIYGVSYSSNDGLSYTGARSTLRWFSHTNTASMGGNTGTYNTISKIIGINRISGGNA